MHVFACLLDFVGTCVKVDKQIYVSLLVHTYTLPQKPKSQDKKKTEENEKPKKISNQRNS